MLTGLLGLALAAAPNPPTWLADMAGEWAVEHTVILPDDTPLSARGTLTATLVLGGSGLAFDSTVSFGPRALHGHGLRARVPATERYACTWADTASPHGIAVGEGRWDPTRQIFTETLTGPDPTGRPMTWTVTTAREGAGWRVDYTIDEPTGPRRIMTLSLRRAR